METTFGTGFEVTSDMLKSFSEKGYVLIRKLFNEDEVAAMLKNVEDGEEFQKYSCAIKDNHGNHSYQITWNTPGNDVIGMAAKCEKIVGTCAKLLGGEVYHYHSKLVIKGPKTGGERTWHQDYGYWYHNGCLFPDMMTVFAPLTKADRTNGCLQVLEGSHRAGRLEHGYSGNEQGADKERVEALKATCPLKYIEMAPGDALFFHCNLLHMSDVNTSESKRVAFLPAYNKASNNPVKKCHHPQYTPLQMVPDSAILKCQNFTDTSGKDFLDMTSSKTLKDQVKFDN